MRNADKSKGPRWVQFWGTPGLVDVVEGRDAAARFLVVTEAGPALTDKLAVGRVEIEPPPGLGKFYPLPTWRALDSFREPDAALFGDVAAFISAHLQTPEDSEIEYQLLAAWVLHTYLYERFDATPFLFFSGAFESGKSRAASTLRALSRHGVVTVGLTGPALFRVNEFTRPALFIEELHLSKDSSDIRDLLNVRYKRDGHVVRVNPDREGLDSLETFAVFGPTVIATTAGLPGTIRSRCFTFPMLTASRRVCEALDMDAAAYLRDRLTAFRARHLIAPLPMLGNRSYTGRLRELATPLHTMFRLACPQAENAFVRYVTDAGASQRAELQGDLEFEVVRALVSMRPEIGGDGAISVRAVTASVNSESEGEAIDGRAVGRIMMKLGFPAARHHGGERTRIIDTARLERLGVKYGILDASPARTSPTSHTSPPEADALARGADTSPLTSQPSALASQEDFPLPDKDGTLGRLGRLAECEPDADDLSSQEGE